MSQRVYLAGRYSRRLELCGYRDQLHRLGYTVAERDSDSPSSRAAALRQKFAQDDFRDVVECDLLIAFTEPPRSEKNRGGRHVELGIALGLKKGILIVGPRENIFCWLEGLRQFDTWERCVGWLGS